MLSIKSLEFGSRQKHFLIKQKACLKILAYEIECYSRRCLKPGLHIVVTVAESACNDASKRILRLSIYPFQIFLVKQQYL